MFGILYKDKRKRCKAERICVNICSCVCLVVGQAYVRKQGKEITDAICLVLKCISCKVHTA